MNVFQSIRWRLQAWHGLMLFIVLMAFGFTAYYLVFDNRMRRVDQELQRRALPFIAVLNRFSQPGDRGPGRFRPGEPRYGERRDEGGMPPQYGPMPEPRSPRPPGDDRDQPGQRMDGPRPEPRPDERRPDGRRPEGFRFIFSNVPPGPPDFQELFGPNADGHYYFIVLNPEGEEIRRSTNAPAVIPLPENTQSLTNALTRIREGHRELIQSTRRGHTIVVGHDITPDLVELKRLAWMLAGAGGGVLLLGLAGGWWLATRAIAPISDISATAVKIADGNMDERISTRDTDSEFGQLARVLNRTFDRLQAAFARQVQFTADASHELRTPVSVILSQTQSTLRRERSVEEYKETIQSCQRSALRMRQLIESLLALARVDSEDEVHDQSECELNHVVAEAVEMVRSLASEQNVTLETDLAAVRCHGNAGQLAQVVTNLVSNAIHYNKPGGSVNISLSHEGGLARLRVADTGIGIAASDLPHVFDRFYRADKARSNAQGRTGLGLAITRAIVKRHGGTIAVESEPGKGSTFTVMLPGTAGTAPKPAPARETAVASVA